MKRFTSFHGWRRRSSPCRLHEEHWSIEKTQGLSGRVMDRSVSTGKQIPGENTALRPSPSRRAKMKASPAGLRSLR